MSTDELRQQLADNDQHRQAIRTRVLEERKRYEDKIKELDQLLAQMHPPKLKAVPPSAKSGPDRPTVEALVLSGVTAKPWITMKEIQTAIGCSQSSAENAFRKLIETGKVIKDQSRPLRYALTGTALAKPNGNGKPSPVAAAS